MHQKEEQKTILIMDAPDLATEVICKSIFPNLKIILSSPESSRETILEDKLACIVLATKDLTITKYALESHEISNTDIVPYRFVFTDAAKTNEKILSKLVFYEFFRLSQQTLRNKANLLLNLSFNNILNYVEKEYPSIQVVSKKPQLFYWLIQSIESKNPLHFNVFLKELSSISSEDKKHLVKGIIAFISGSNQSLAFGQLFYPFFNDFIEDDNFFKVQEPVLALMDSLVHLLGKDIFKINGFNFTANALFTAFDKDGAFTTLETIRLIIDKSSVTSNQLFQFALSKLFQNKNYELPNHEFDQVNSSKSDNCMYESIQTILEFSDNQPHDLSQIERFRLIQVISNYATYLLTNPTEIEKAKFLDEHNIRI
jgi:hypothetical protein